MKTFIIMIMFSALLICGCKSSVHDSVVLDASTIETEPPSTADKQIDEEGFFFNNISSEIEYNVRQSISEDIPLVISLDITMTSKYENGCLYRIKCNIAKDIPERYEGGVDRLSLGYFYVPIHENTIYRIREEDMTEDILHSEEKLVSVGTIVCQEGEKLDTLGKDEKGWHEYITADGDKREYHSYNNLIETGYYERFVWERGRGLVYYTSGFGAEGDMIELTIK